MRLRNKYLTAIVALGRYRERQQQWQAAINCYQRGLVEIDDLAELFYQCLMVCYGQLGQAIAVTSENRGAGSGGTGRFAGAVCVS